MAAVVPLPTSGQQKPTANQGRQEHTRHAPVREWSARERLRVRAQQRAVRGGCEQCPARDARGPVTSSKTARVRLWARGCGVPGDLPIGERLIFKAFVISSECAPPVMAARDVGPTKCPRVALRGRCRSVRRGGNTAVLTSTGRRIPVPDGADARPDIDHCRTASLKAYGLGRCRRGAARQSSCRHAERPDLDG